MAMQSETQYARSGNTHIAYQIVGQGPIDIVYVPGWVSHVELCWEEPTYARFLNQLCSFARLIMFDKRGTGLSDQVRDDQLPTLEERMDDLHVVMEAAGSKSAALIGFSEGGNLSALFAATYPERVTALVMFGTFAKRIWAQDYPWAPTPEERQKDYEFVEREWGNLMDLEHYVPSMVEDKAFARRLATYFRRSASPGAAVTLLRMNTQIDITNVLPAIHVPTLVIHRTGDRDAKVEEGRWIADHIPGARFKELPGDDHFPWVGDQDKVVNEIQEFLTGSRSAPVIDRVLATVLISDIVESTPRAEALGDQRWQEIMETHNRIVRTELERWRGIEIRFTGDGFLTSFDGPARAIRCAMAISQNILPLGIEVRLGLHTGEVEFSGGEVHGIAVNTATRISALAGASEVLVSRTVKDLVAGSGIRLDHWGQHALKGLAEPMDVYSVGG